MIPAHASLQIHKYDTQNNLWRHQVVYCLLSWKALELTSCISGFRKDPGVFKWKEDVSQTESLSGNPEDGASLTHALAHSDKCLLSVYVTGHLVVSRM